MKVGIYGKTFLTKPRLISTDKEKVDKSPIQWRENVIDGEPCYTTSIMGILNAPLNKIGLVLVAEVEDDKYVCSYKILKKWW